ncbi:U1 small nuclear ribonucleoprotein [Pleurostoma richardsiae]|uniref:U1 small nuclear ribonucleoprotein n=1 Tax=Pleurostoma richardsiae TaxID=41990 RepID=A0AA38S2J6_9PEZI|nr:U1 small nuclear ribonucleoprotein [Pleurostoma richardsiae]
MTDKLPPNLLALFAPRPPLRWVPPCDFPPEQRKTAPVGGVADYLPAMTAYKDADNYVPTESWLERRDRKKREHEAKIKEVLTDGPKQYNPNEDPNIRGDAFKTLVVARLSYDATEEDLEKEFGRMGAIERIRIVRDTHAGEKGNKKKKPHRGYAFVVFEREKDMRAAIDQLDGINIKGRNVKLDVERGRTVKGWKPRRLGGGLGGRGYTKAMPSRPMGPGGFSGGFRGGRGGGFRREGGFRGGFDRGPRGGFGGPRGDRGFGGQQNGFGGPPPNAPGGPGYGGRDGGYGGYGGRSDRRDFSGGGYDRRGGGSFDDRHGGGGGYRGADRSGSGSNAEPIGSRPSGGYRDRDRDRDRDYGRRDDDSRKRPYEGGSGYDEHRKLRRY